MSKWSHKLNIILYRLRKISSSGCLIYNQCRYGQKYDSQRLDIFIVFIVFSHCIITRQGSTKKGFSKIRIFKRISSMDWLAYDKQINVCLYLCVELQFIIENSIVIMIDYNFRSVFCA